MSMQLPTPQDLLERRNDLGLTQSELADAAGVSQPLIARIEGGDVDPRLSTLRGIVEALDEFEGGIVRAADVMHEDVVSVEPGAPVREAVAKMQEHGFSQLPVITGGAPEGLITESDVVHAGQDVGDEPVSEYMSGSFSTEPPEATVEKLSNLLDHHEAVLITEGGETIGIVTKTDLAARVS